MIIKLLGKWVLIKLPGRIRARRAVHGDKKTFSERDCSPAHILPSLLPELSAVWDTFVATGRY